MPNNMTAYLEIRVLAYLKYPKVKWIYHTEVGGSFTNSGEYRSIEACTKAFYTRSNNCNRNLPVRIVTVEGFDACDNPVETIRDSYLNKELPVSMR